MLKIYICPTCYNFRMVSRKPDAICFHCGTDLELTDIDYTNYINMTEEKRSAYKESFMNRMKLYRDKYVGVKEESAVE